MDACRVPRHLRVSSLHATPPGRLPFLLASALLLLLLLSSTHVVVAVPANNSTAALPEIPKSVHTIICSPSGCTTHSSETPPPACTTPGTVLVYDTGPCFHAATSHAGFKPFDLSKCSGGEVIFCKQILNLLEYTGFTFVQTRWDKLLESCVLAGQARGVEHVLFVHGHLAWTSLKSGEMLADGYIIRPPFREDCLISMTLWGTAKPWLLWPGDLRYYITSFPYPDNSYVLMAKPSNCPTSKTFKQPRLPPYGVLFEKFKVMPGKVNNTNRFAHNASFWAEMQQRVHLVVLDCSDALAAKLQWGEDYRERVTCWKDSPLSQEFSYNDLMMGASFFLGLGATGQSPTPVDLNYCRTPIIMTPNQHLFIPKHARPREYYPVLTSEAVLAAVDDILAHCKVTFVRGDDGAITKNSTCFQDPPSLDEALSMDVLGAEFKKMMKARSVPCFIQPKQSEEPKQSKPPVPVPVGDSS